ncbi:MAG: acetyl-CoA carboxylase biotin carboxylase subunit [Thermofilaceae archaeon]
MQPIFDKILVANRGEIAVRIIRTAKMLGIKTVAVYSDADQNALHALIADEAVWVGGADPSESYLNVEAIINAAKSTGAEAVHPGYGFLSQRADFVERLEEEGITFIGPSARVQKLVGDKLGARRFFQSAGIPVVPGTFEPVDPRDAPSVAEEMGYPVIVKPAGGGGGIGMRVVWNEHELSMAMRDASELAGKAFGRVEVYLEKYLPKARHIEVQIIGDGLGGVYHLFERECSVQRRFQKVVEEAPSPALTWELRQQLLSVAIKAAKACEYVNAGTFEFLFDPESKRFYLLEVNSRIQVEHPVTEMVTGVDIVKEQILVAGGEGVSFKQEDVTIRGHSIEARVYAEDPLNNFAPSPGRLTSYREPSGPYVRVDSGYYAGCEVPPFYDPLLMKIVSWGSNREEARRRLIIAIEETVVKGVATNLGLLHLILNDEAFVKGDYNTRFFEERKILQRLENHIVREVHFPEPKEHAEDRKPHARVEVDIWKLASRIGG